MKTITAIALALASLTISSNEETMQNQTNFANQIVVASAPVDGYTTEQHVALGDTIAISKDTYAEGERAVLATSGEFGTPDVVPAEQWSEGDRIYYNETTGLFTAEPTHWPVGRAGEAKDAQTAGNGFGVVQLDAPHRETGEILFAVRFGPDFAPGAGAVGDHVLRSFGGNVVLEECEVISDSLGSTGAATISLGDGSGVNNQVLPAQTLVTLDGYVPVDAINEPDVLPVALDRLVMRISVAAVNAGYLVVKGRFVKAS